MKERLTLIRTHTVVEKVMFDVQHPENATASDLIAIMIRQASRDTAFWEPVSSDSKLTVRNAEMGE